MAALGRRRKSVPDPRRVPARAQLGLAALGHPGPAQRAAGRGGEGGEVAVALRGRRLVGRQRVARVRQAWGADFRRCQK